MGKFSLKSVGSFLNKHAHDLDAIGVALQGIVAALPINQETRASINQAVTRVTDSAANIRTSLEEYGILHDDAAHVTPDAAMAALLGTDEGKAVLSRVMADYMAAHPQAGGVTPQVDQSAATAAKAGDDMQAGDRSGSQQAGKGGERVEATAPLPGVTKQEEAPAPSTETSAEQRDATDKAPEPAPAD